MTVTRYIAAAVCAASVLSAAAQTQLSTEVVVDRTVEPARRAATRPANLYPELVLPPVGHIDLNTARYAGFGPVTRDYTPLAAASAPALTSISPWRGYLSAGYFPTYNLGVSAGYRLLNSHRTRLSLWGQFDGMSFKDKDESNFSQKFNGARIGIDLSQRVGENSHLTAKLSGGYDSYESMLLERQTLGTADLSVSWLSKAGPVHYLVGISGALDSYGDAALRADKDIKITAPDQRMFGFAAAASYAFDRNQRAGLDIEGDWVSSSCGPTPLGTVGFTPFYAWQSRRFAARLGARLDVATGGEGSKFSAAPRVNISWMPTGRFALYGTATGGMMLNPLRDLRQYTPFMPAILAYGRSKVPVDATVGFNVGPVSGLTVEVSGSYARADDRVMPVAIVPISMMPADVSAFRAGIKVTYEYGRLLTVSAGAQFAQSSATKAWYEWLDRASTVINAEATVRPLDALKINVGYEFRGGRKMLSLDGTTGLGCKSDLMAGAAYDFTEQFGVFARVENILGRRYAFIPGVESQGAHGLVGVNLKF